MSLDSLFRPRHVAVIGASRTPGKSGHAVVKNLITCGFTGLVTPVNPAGGEVEGIACATAIADIADPIDCAMIVLPAAGVVAAVRACAAHGVKSVIVGASGFAETNTAQGRDWQAALTAIAADAGMRLLGPNTNGLFNANDRVSIGYNAAHADVRRHLPQRRAVRRRAEFAAPHRGGTREVCSGRQRGGHRYARCPRLSDRRPRHHGDRHDHRGDFRRGAVAGRGEPGLRGGETDRCAEGRALAGWCRRGAGAFQPPCRQRAGL
jgi:predicted CoA-binding protein